MSATKVLWICSDVHFGDYNLKTIHSVTGNATVDSGKSTKLTLITDGVSENEHQLNPGDLVCIAGVGANTNGLNDAGDPTYNNISTYVSVLDTPHYLDCRVLQVDLKNKIIKKYQLVLDKMPLSTSEVENIKKTIMYFNNAIEDKERLKKSFKTYNCSKSSFPEITH